MYCLTLLFEGVGRKILSHHADTTTTPKKSLQSRARARAHGKSVPMKLHARSSRAGPRSWEGRRTTRSARDCCGTLCVSCRTEGSAPRMRNKPSRCEPTMEVRCILALYSVFITVANQSLDSTCNVSRNTRAGC
jgi:hypothetical protein